VCIFPLHRHGNKWIRLQNDFDAVYSDIFGTLAQSSTPVSPCTSLVSHGILCFLFERGLFGEDCQGRDFIFQFYSRFFCCPLLFNRMFSQLYFLLEDGRLHCHVPLSSWVNFSFFVYDRFSPADLVGASPLFLLPLRGSEDIQLMARRRPLRPDLPSPPLWFLTLCSRPPGDIFFDSTPILPWWIFLASLLS